RARRGGCRPPGGWPAWPGDGRRGSPGHAGRVVQVRSARRRRYRTPPRGPPAVHHVVAPAPGHHRPRLVLLVGFGRVGPDVEIDAVRGPPGVTVRRLAARRLDDAAEGHGRRRGTWTPSRDMNAVAMSVRTRISSA